MQLEYHWDRNLYEALLRYRARQILNYISASMRETSVGTPSDIQRLIGRMQRAQTLTDRAAASAGKSETVMDAFEHTLGLYDQQIEKVSEYDSQLRAMLAVNGNGGEPLDQTFPTSTQDAAPAVVAAAEPAAPAPHSTVTPRIDLMTGDPLR